MTEPLVSEEDLATGAALFARPWTFVKGVVALEGLPPADRPEVAFAGRSNVGKSSLINALASDSGMARTSNTPGRTQELNFFAAPGGHLLLVDLPGYGFAKAPKEIVAGWQAVLKDYLRGRVNLARVFLLIDSRHGIKREDEEIMALLDASAVSYQAVLTKSDKLNARQTAAVLAATQEKLRTHAAAFPAVLVTSSEKSEGLEVLRGLIAAISREHRRR